MINIPIDAKEIIKVLQDNKYKAYVVGGCVRDCILGRKPKDWDITTNATPDKVIEIFSNYNVIPTGLKHGTVTIMINSIPYEVTTFRTDGVYSDGRHPDSVTFTNDLNEDLSRRDFTINAMAYNDDEGLIDYFNGQKHLSWQEIHCVGEAEDRFQEDALRMLRAVRFASQLGFEVHRSIDYAIEEKLDLLKNISKERIREEFNKILLSNNINGLQILTNWNVMKYICPEILSTYGFNQYNPYHSYNVYEHILKSVELIPNDLILKLTMFFHDIGKPKCFTKDENECGHFYGHNEISSQIAYDTLKDLRYDNSTITKVRDLVLYHDAEIQDTKKSVRRWLNKIGEENFKEIIKIRIADILSQNLIYATPRLEKIFKIKQLLEEVLNTKECFSKKDLAINGTDLIKLGYAEGKQIGETINKLIELVLDSPELNTKEQLIEKIKTL